MQRTATSGGLAIVLACVPACEEPEEDPAVAELVHHAADTEDDDDDAFDNQTACYTVAARVPCGGNRLARELGCPSIHVYPCDLGAYFDCVEDHVLCTGTGLDTSEVPACLELLACE